MATAAATYEPRATERGVLHSVVREHLETFLVEAARAGREGVRLPEFVEQEFLDFLTCGVLAHGFARVRCDTCAFERLVPFSCKGRGFCPSCGGRRMTERAARLVMGLLPRSPVRQWVLSLPYRLRYLLAWNRELCRAVLGVFARTLLDFYRRRARRHGTADGRTGAVTVIQRFGGGLNLNVHSMPTSSPSATPVFNPDGDCLAAKLRPGNVHSADGWDDVLLPIIDRSRAQGQTVVVRADAAFARPALYEALDRWGVRYAIRLPANAVLERTIEDLLTRRCRPTEPAPLVRYRSFSYQAAPWDRPRRVIAKIEHHLGELFPRVGLHRHDLDRDESGRRPLLQPAWGGGTVDQGGQSCHPLDASFLPPLPGQRGPPLARRHRL